MIKTFKKDRCILALKPKPWLTAPGALMILKENPDKTTSDTDIIPLTSYRILGGVVKGRETTSRVAITNRNNGIQGYIRLNNTHEYFIERKFDVEDMPITEVIQKQFDGTKRNISRRWYHNMETAEQETVEELYQIIRRGENTVGQDERLESDYSDVRIRFVRIHIETATNRIYPS